MNAASDPCPLNCHSASFGWICGTTTMSPCATPRAGKVGRRAEGGRIRARAVEEEDEGRRPVGRYDRGTVRLKLPGNRAVLIGQGLRGAGHGGGRTDVVGAEVVGRHPGEAAIVLLAPTGTAAETL